ncbi:MarC family NAAT transporter [Shigella flexneri]
MANPLTTVAFFLGLAGNMNSAERNRQSLMASVYVFAIMMVAYYAGQGWDWFGIGFPGYDCGWVNRCVYRLSDVFPSRRRMILRKRGASLKSRRRTDGQYAFVPLAMPSTAGPGTIASDHSSASTVRQGSIFRTGCNDDRAADDIFAVVGSPVGCLRSSRGIMRLVVKGGIEAISRLMGFLLVCIGVQFIINGVLEMIKAYA